MRKNTDQNYSEYLHFLGSDIYAEDHEDSKKLKVEKRMPNRLQIIHEQSLLKYESYVLSCPLVLSCHTRLFALDFSCISLIFFCLFATCDFLGEFTKVKANIVCQQYLEVAIIIYQQYDIFENIYI